MDLFTIMPDRTYRKGETQLANGRTVAQLLLGGRAEIEDAVITSPIKMVAQAKRGRWRFRGYLADALPLSQYTTYCTKFALPNQLALKPSQTLGIDDANVRAEVERVANEKTPHPPPPPPIRFLAGDTQAVDITEERNDTAVEVNPAGKAVTQQGHTDPEHSQEYLQMEEVILVLTDEVEELHYILDTRQERPHHEFPPAATTRQKKQNGQAPHPQIGAR